MPYVVVINKSMGIFQASSIYNSQQLHVIVLCKLWSWMKPRNESYIFLGGGGGFLYRHDLSGVMHSEHINYILIFDYIIFLTYKKDL